MKGFNAILSVGSAVHPELPWTTINSNGWLARVSSGDKNLPSEYGQANPIAALGAASLGVGDVFKRLIRLKLERGELLNGFSYSLRTYSAQAENCGPELPTHFGSDLLVVGAGAIGNGLVHLIAELPFTGTVGIVDSQEYQPENLGTCILIGPTDLWSPKAETLANHLKLAGINARGFHMPFEWYLKESHNAPMIVLNGLDNIDARHDVQRSLWPDVLIDGAIGDFTCQVSRHPWPSDIACLICVLQKPQAESAEKVQRKATGLSLGRVADPNAAVTQWDVDNAPLEKQQFLRERIGRPFCSVIQEAVAQQISDERQPEKFAPSVPFVACFSACMVISEIAGHICGWPSELAPRFQFDFLMGPIHGQRLPQQRRPDCVCARQENIDGLRAKRTGARGAVPKSDERSGTHSSKG
jgi:molybdopterin/thiamine biosynthesis adenylyltransferase